MIDQVKIFVSHHHSPDEDRFTDQLVRDLQAAGADVWVDNDITSGNFVAKISAAMTDRQWLVLVMTPAALRSHWVQEEVDAALHEVQAGRMRDVIPIVMEPCNDREIPLLWRTLQRYDASRDYAAAVAGVVRAIGLSAAPPSQSEQVRPPIRRTTVPVAALPPSLDGPAMAGTDGRENPQGGHKQARWRLALYAATAIVLVFASTAALLRVINPGSGASPQTTPGTSGTSGVTEYPLPHALSEPDALVAGPDSNLWFTEFGASKIGRITPQGAITEFPLPTPNSHPLGLVVGSSGIVWFAEFDGNKIGRYGPNSQFAEYPVPTPQAEPDSIVFGPDGRLWFTEYTGNKIGHLLGNGHIEEFPVPTRDSHPAAIVLGPDGNLWFTERQAGKVARLNPNGSFKEFPLQNPNSLPNGLILGPDGNFWFTEIQTNKLGTITTKGAIHELALPPPNVFPTVIIVGPDNNLWFTERGTNKIARMTLSGKKTEFSIPTADSYPLGLAPGPDGAVWFAEFDGNKIGRIVPPNDGA